MKIRLVFLVKYIAFWFSLFFLARFLFIGYNYWYTHGMSVRDFFGSFIQGAKLDMSIIGYMMLMYCVLMVFVNFLKPAWQQNFSRYFTILMLVIISTVVIADMELYRHWGYRMDSLVLEYLKTPKEAFASTPILLTLLLFFVVFLFGYIQYKIYRKVVAPKTKKLTAGKWYFSLVFLVLGGSCIIPIRGGYRGIPFSHASVYFSNNIFANHAALNVVWNFAESLSNSKKEEGITFMDNSLAHENVQRLLVKNSDAVTTKLLNTDRPNVVLIVMESMFSSVIEPLGGEPGVTPNLNKLCNEGVLFSNVWAAGDHSDRGLAAIFSGIPALPNKAILHNVKKLEKLPHLSANLEKLGYSTGFYYGGDMSFANMKAYFYSGGYDKVVSGNDFSGSGIHCSWGVYDHVVFNRFFNDIQSSSKPFFMSMFTINSHVPYDVPHHSQFNDRTETSKFFNSVHYTDSCIGDFINKAKVTDWWQNSLVIFVADHGISHPGNLSSSELKKFSIPMLWVGGAVKKDTIIDLPISQFDIPLMIGNQINEKFDDFVFSKDVLSGDRPWGYYVFTNGFGYVTSTSKLIWDNNGAKKLLEENASPQDEADGKSFMQVVSDYYLAE